MIKFFNKKVLNIFVVKEIVSIFALKLMKLFVY